MRKMTTIRVSHNRFSEFTLKELLNIRTNLLSTSTYGYDDGGVHKQLYEELDRAYDEKNAAMKALIPKCSKCGHDLK